jgi:hypothetical protein
MAGRDEYMQSTTNMHTYKVSGGDAFKAVSHTQAQGNIEHEQGGQTSGKNVLKPRVDPKGAVGPPLDYSYSEIQDISQLAQTEPNSGKAKSRPTSTTDEEGSLPSAGKNKSARSYKTTGLRLGYNQLADLVGALQAFDAVMDDPRKNLNMLDLSYNQFQTIPAELTQFSNISVLYLHGNLIIDVNEIKKLKKLKNLQKLTLQGNAVFYEATEKSSRRAVKLEDISYYRCRIIYHLRGTKLKSLDNIAITPKDRENALIWYKNHRDR